MSDSLALVLLRCLLGVLAVYHIGIGLASTLSLQATASITRRMYAIELGASPQLDYAIKMLGLYALVVGGLLVMAAWRPLEHRAIIIAVIVLLLLRAMARLGNATRLEHTFGVSRGRNTAHAGLLIAEAAALSTLSWYLAH